METLEALDRSIVLAINGMNSPFLDEFMWIVSGKLTWFPLYLFLIFLFFKQFGSKKTVVFVIAAVCAVAIADLVSVHLFKNLFERYRPSHHSLLTEKLHFYKYENGELYKGGQFGFVSSHAANFVAICTFVLLTLKKHYRFLVPLLLICTTLVLYSRIYLGVHYLSDVLVGSLVGALAAFIAFRFIFTPIINKDFRLK